MPFVIAVLALLKWCSLNKVLNMTEFDFDDAGLESYTTDADREAESGIWVKFPGDRAFRILRAGGSNKEFLRAFRLAIRPYKRQLDKDTMDPATSDKLTRELYARHIIKDWSGIKTKAGVEIPYSPEACVAFMTRYPEILNDLVTLASEMATFQDRVLEEAKTSLGEG
jgi:hypothetical protein